MQATTPLQPLLGTLNLLDADDAGCCSGGVCAYPGSDAQKASKPE